MEEDDVIVGGTEGESFVREKNIEDKMVEAYIGKDAPSIRGGGVNWVAAVLGQAIGPIWFFYRRAHLVGVLFLVLTYIVGDLASRINFDKAYYIMFFIYLFSANKLYLWDVKRKVKKILEKDPMASESELLERAKQKGKGSILAVIIYIVVFILYIWLMFMSYMALFRMATEIYG